MNIIPEKSFTSLHVSSTHENVPIEGAIHSGIKYSSNDWETQLLISVMVFVGVSRQPQSVL